MPGQTGPGLIDDGFDSVRLHRDPRGGVLPVGGYVDELDRNSQSRLVGNYLERAGSGSIGQQKVQLTWDDGVKAMVLAHDMAWADTYIGEFLWSNFQNDRLFLITPQGKLIRAWQEGKPTQADTFAPVRAQVDAGLAKMATNREIFGNPAQFGSCPTPSGRLMPRERR